MIFKIMSICRLAKTGRVLTVMMLLFFDSTIAVAQLNIDDPEPAQNNIGLLARIHFNTQTSE